MIWITQQIEDQMVQLIEQYGEWTYDIRSTDVFQLPRIQVHNWNGDQFTEQLVGWFDD